VHVSRNRLSSCSYRLVVVGGRKEDAESVMENMLMLVISLQAQPRENSSASTCCRKPHVHC
jgi:hypothetical protein